VNAILSEIGPGESDGVRRQWIARYASVYPIEKGRAEILNRQIRDRHANWLVIEPAQITTTSSSPCPQRRAQLPDGYIEAAIVGLLNRSAGQRESRYIRPSSGLSRTGYALLCTRRGVGDRWHRPPDRWRRRPPRRGSWRRDN
jgi:hypothetical protein